MSIKFLLLSISLSGVCAGQTTNVEWSSFSMGYAELKSGATIIKSVVGESFIGTTQQANTQVICGFLADTLFHRSPVAVNTTDELPTIYSLSQNYPNPFNPSTTVHFELPRESNVTLKVYNMLGQEMLNVIDQVKAAGRYDLKIDGKSLASGVYFYRLTAGDYVSTRRLILLK
jgi:hypothetical protein